MPVNCLLGNDREHTAWNEVELKSHLEMLGLPECVCMTTRSMAAREGSQVRLEPGTMAQTAAKRKGKRCGKPASNVPTVVDGAPEEEEAPEPTGEDIADLGNLPELAGWQVEGGPTRAEVCKTQKECPTLDGLRQQATSQAAGDASGTHHIYWENDLLYSEPKVPGPGTAHVRAVPQCYRNLPTGSGSRHHPGRTPGPRQDL
ncbi:hypothetical protein NDU88_005491 [Pleurodeles waltl]|uniref:Uncharacterized protein n=1 Tax=Pleurodeles waltl TaxID=8319 RepID=A0AAV7W800_PLEWA|nr:hypothetical protein NDU88_005491 [Pleurodeles waltl]